MKIKEITNAQDQLDLLRVIIDNTWTAIKQQADVQAKQNAVQPVRPPKAKAIKKAPYAAPPKPLPKPKQQVAQPKLAKPVNHPSRDNLGAPKQVASKSKPLRSPEEMRIFMDYLKGEKSKTAQTNQNQAHLPS